MYHAGHYPTNIPRYFDSRHDTITFPLSLLIYPDEYSGPTTSVEHPGPWPHRAVEPQALCLVYDITYEMAMPSYSFRWVNVNSALEVYVACHSKINFCICFTPALKIYLIPKVELGDSTRLDGASIYLRYLNVN